MWEQNILVRSGIRTHAWRTRLRPERSALDRSAILTYIRGELWFETRRLRYPRGETKALQNCVFSGRDAPVISFVVRDVQDLGEQGSFRSVVVITFA